jgi:acyl-CoA thioester hydrolase
MIDSVTPHRFPVRVYYEDTDAGGIVYYANYFRFLERARTEMLREQGILQSTLAREESKIFVVGELHGRYLAPARLDDRLIVETTVTHIGGASLKMTQNVLKQVEQTDTLLFKGGVTLVYVTHAGKTIRLCDRLRAALTTYYTTKEG